MCGEKMLILSQKHIFNTYNIQINLLKVNYYSIDEVNNISTSEKHNPRISKNSKGFMDIAKRTVAKLAVKVYPNP